MSDLSALKPGDRVVVAEYRYGSTYLGFDTIEKITPTGRFVTKRGSTYRPDGELYGRREVGCSRTIYVPTLELVQRARAQIARRRLKQIAWSKVPDDVAIAVVELLGEVEQ